jgi:hypothetical protein
MKTITVHIEDDLYLQWGQEVIKRNVMGSLGMVDDFTLFLLHGIESGKTDVTFTLKKQEEKRKKRRKR